MYVYTTRSKCKLTRLRPSHHLFQGRLYSYSDTHRHRLGSNYLQLPVNCPFNTKARNYQRDGPQCVDDNQGQWLPILWYSPRHPRACTHTHTLGHTHTHLHTQTYMYTCMHTRMHTHMCTHTHTYTFLCVCVFYNTWNTCPPCLELLSNSELDRF